MRVARLGQRRGHSTQCSRLSPNILDAPHDRQRLVNLTRLQELLRHIFQRPRLALSILDASRDRQCLVDLAHTGHGSHHTSHLPRPSLSRLNALRDCQHLFQQCQIRSIILFAHVVYGHQPAVSLLRSIAQACVGQCLGLVPQQDKRLEVGIRMHAHARVNHLPCSVELGQRKQVWLLLHGQFEVGYIGRIACGSDKLNLHPVRRTGQQSDEFVNALCSNIMMRQFRELAEFGAPFFSFVKFLATKIVCQRAVKKRFIVSNQKASFDCLPQLAVIEDQQCCLISRSFGKVGQQIKVQP